MNVLTEGIDLEQPLGGRDGRPEIRFGLQMSDQSGQALQATVAQPFARLGQPVVEFRRVQAGAGQEVVRVKRDGTLQGSPRALGRQGLELADIDSKPARHQGNMLAVDIQNRRPAAA